MGPKYKIYFNVSRLKSKLGWGGGKVQLDLSLTLAYFPHKLYKLSGYDYQAVTLEEKKHTKTVLILFIERSRKCYCVCIIEQDWIIYVSSPGKRLPG